MSRLCQLILHAGTGKLTAVKNKYQSSKFMRISKLQELDSQLVRDMSECSDSTSQWELADLKECDMILTASVVPAFNTIYIFLWLHGERRHTMLWSLYDVVNF